LLLILISSMVEYGLFPLLGKLFRFSLVNTLQSQEILNRPVFVLEILKSVQYHLVFLKQRHINSPQFLLNYTKHHSTPD
jgi:hypothetical protein